MLAGSSSPISSEEQRFRETFCMLEGVSRAATGSCSAPATARTCSPPCALSIWPIYPQGSAQYRLPVGFAPEDPRPSRQGGRCWLSRTAGEFAALGRRVLVGWDGSREAARAAHDVLPLCSRKAELVTLLTVGEREADFERNRPVERLLKNYERHGIPARVRRPSAAILRLADVLLSRAGDRDADSDRETRPRTTIRNCAELLFGGVTRDLLDPHDRAGVDVALSVGTLSRRIARFASTSGNSGQRATTNPIATPARSLVGPAVKPALPSSSTRLYRDIPDRRGARPSPAGLPPSPRAPAHRRSAAPRRCRPRGCVPSRAAQAAAVLTTRHGSRRPGHGRDAQMHGSHRLTRIRG